MANSNYSTVVLDSFTLESGFVLRQVEVAYRTWGTLNETGDNAVVVFHSMTGDSDATSWWGSLVGPDRAVCTLSNFVICANLLGSCYGTTGPTSLNPDTGETYRASFPICTVRDQVRLHLELVEYLGVQQVRQVVGGSLGGFMALEWAVLDPNVAEVIAVATSGRHSAWCIGWTEVQRQAIYADPNWNGGFYTSEVQPDAGLATARMMAMMSYRNTSSFGARFGRAAAAEKDNTDSLRAAAPSIPPETRANFSVETYLRYQGQKLVSRFDANSYVRLTQTSNSHDLARDRGEYIDVLGSIKARVLVVGVDTDILFPLEEQKELAQAIPQATLEVITSPHGHDGFLLEGDTLNHIVKNWLSGSTDQLHQPDYQLASCV